MSRTNKNIEDFFAQLSSLREFARRVIVQGLTLTQDEEVEKGVMMADLFEVGKVFQLTEREIVKMLLNDMLLRGGATA